MTPIKIGFVLLSNSRQPLPSTRVVVLNMLPFLSAAQFEPHIVFDPPGNVEQPQFADDFAQRLAAQGFRIVFFQKARGPHVEALARRLRTLGVRTVFGVCDLVDEDMVRVTDATVAVTDYLKSLYAPALQPKIHVIHDGIENSGVHKSDWGDERGTRLRPLRAVLVTSASLTRLPIIGAPPPWLQVTIVGRYAATSQPLQRLREAHWKLAGMQGRERWDYVKFLLDERIRTRAWDPEGVYRHMQQADIGIIPVDKLEDSRTHLPVPLWSVKSENRLTMKMCMALPVVATPIPSYEPVLRHGVDGFFASTPREWLECLEALRDPALRRQVGQRARASVLERYSLQDQARRFVALLQSLLHERRVEAPSVAPT